MNGTDMKIITDILEYQRLFDKDMKLELPQFDADNITTDSFPEYFNKYIESQTMSDPVSFWKEP